MHSRLRTDGLDNPRLDKAKDVAADESESDPGASDGSESDPTHAELFLPDEAGSQANWIIILLSI